MWWPLLYVFWAIKVTVACTIVWNGNAELIRFVTYCYLTLSRFHVGISTQRFKYKYQELVLCSVMYGSPAYFLILNFEWSVHPTRERNVGRREHDFLSAKKFPYSIESRERKMKQDSEVTLRYFPQLCRILHQNRSIGRQIITSFS